MPFNQEVPKLDPLADLSKLPDDLLGKNKSKYSSEAHAQSEQKRQHMLDEKRKQKKDELEEERKAEREKAKKATAKEESGIVAAFKAMRQYHEQRSRKDSWDIDDDDM